MESDEITLLAQLIDSLDISMKKLEHAYNRQSKQEFEQSKKIILDFQNKISYLLKK